jgi:hypothetical protein
MTKKKILVKKSVFNDDTVLDKGAVVLINLASPTMIKFLRNKHRDDPKCITGDVNFLYKFDGVKFDIKDDDDEYNSNYTRFLTQIWNKKRKKRGGLKFISPIDPSEK